MNELPPKLVLASSSPRRRELLATLHRDFAVVSPDIIEKPKANETPIDYVRRNAREKAERVSKSHAQSIVIAADTVVVLGETILEKPADAAEARQMLASLSGQIHLVFTGLCVRRQLPKVVQKLTHVESRIYFRTLSDAEILRYVALGESLDKAGAYGAQGEAAKFIKKVEGSFTNVIGLPMEVLKNILEVDFGQKFALDAPKEDLC